LPLPALSTVQVGSLGLEGAQVLFEAIRHGPARRQSAKAWLSYPGKSAKRIVMAVGQVNKARRGGRGERGPVHDVLRQFAGGCGGGSRVDDSGGRGGWCR